MIKKIRANKKYWTKQTFCRLAFLSVAAVICFLIVDFIYSFIPVFDIQQLTNQDVELNDIYYHIRKKESIAEHDGIVLVNIGSIPAETRRSKMISLLQVLKEYEVKQIGIDISYEGDSLNPAQADSLRLQIQNSGAIVGIYPQQEDYLGEPFGETRNMGLINFPDPDKCSKRRYYNHDDFKGVEMPSMARKIYDKIRLVDDNSHGYFKNVDKEFKLRYQCLGNGYYDYLMKL